MSRMILNVATVEIDQVKYEKLIENETRYNQLFEWQHEHGNDEILRIIDDEKLKYLIGQQETMTCCVDEESAATEEVIEELDDEIKVGDKVKLLSLGFYTTSFNMGDICTVEELRVDDSEECIEIKNCEHGDIGYVSVDMIKKVNEREEN